VFELTPMAGCKVRNTFAKLIALGAWLTVTSSPLGACAQMSRGEWRTWLAPNNDFALEYARDWEAAAPAVEESTSVAFESLVQLRPKARVASPFFDRVGLQPIECTVSAMGISAPLDQTGANAQIATRDMRQNASNLPNAIVRSIENHNIDGVEVTSITYESGGIRFYQRAFMIADGDGAVSYRIDCVIALDTQPPVYSRSVEEFLDSLTFNRNNP
jgi:hypothetical protein